MASFECAVCYSETGSFQKLCCGHVFCKDCVKAWYHKGAAGASCPMCRRPMYFKGFHRVRDEWEAEAYDNKCAEVFSQALDDLFTEAQTFAASFPQRWRARIVANVMEDFVDTEKTYRFMKWHDAHPEDMEDILYYGEYYSDRRVGKYEWDDDPIREWATRYPEAAKTAGRSGKRRRALEDPWCSVTLILV